LKGETKLKENNKIRKIQIQTTLDPELIQFIKEVAVKEKRSFPDMLRFAITEYFEKSFKPNNKKTKGEK
jgi:hypothetical protein